MTPEEHEDKGSFVTILNGPGAGAASIAKYRKWLQPKGLCSLSPPAPSWRLRASHTPQPEDAARASSIELALPVVRLHGQPRRGASWYVHECG